MRILIACCVAMAFFISCSKSDDNIIPDPNIPTPVLPDTLSGGWAKDSSLGQQDFSDVFFTSNSIGYLSTADKIYKTNNGGTNWQPVTIASAAGAANLAAWGANNVTYVSNSSIVTSSTNNFTAYQQHEYFTPGGNVGFFDCFYPSQNTVFLSSGRYVWKSTNAGASFDTIYNFNLFSQLSNIYFLNDNVGWIIRDDGVYNTTNGGTSWTRKVDGLLSYGIIHFVNSSTGFYSANNKVFKTTDGGNNWSQVYASVTGALYFDIAFLDVNNGYISDGKNILKTTDGGATWTKVVRLGNGTIIEIHFTDVNHGWAAGLNTLLKFSM